MTCLNSSPFLNPPPSFHGNHAPPCIPDFHRGHLGHIPLCLRTQTTGKIAAAVTADNLVKNGFALMHDGILFRAEMVGDPEDILIPYANIAKLIRPDGILAEFR